MIPGFLVAWATFPGVVVHELAHAIMCRLFGLHIYEVKYFRLVPSFRQPAGYVIHQPSTKAWQNALVGIGPFFVNTIVGAIIAAPAALTVLQFGGVRDVADHPRKTRYIAQQERGEPAAAKRDAAAV